MKSPQFRNFWILLNIAGSIVTADAMSCQKNIVQKIRDNEADYVIGLKGNQPALHTQLKEVKDRKGDRSISPARLCDQPNAGEGLLFFGSVIIPFVDHFPTGMLTNFHCSAVQHQRCLVHQVLLNQGGKDSFPYSCFCPCAKPAIYTLPWPEAPWQIPPWNPSIQPV